MREAEYVSIPQLAKLLGISRTAVYKKVKKGQIKAIRIGRSFAISKEFITNNIVDVTGGALKPKEKEEIEAAVKKTVREYGEVLKKLGRE